MYDSLAMFPSRATSEIIEELSLGHGSSVSSSLKFKLKRDQTDGKSHVYPVDDEPDWMTSENHSRTTLKSWGPPHQKRAPKKPDRRFARQASGAGNAEPLSIKQALRRLSISQASEVAAMKRLLKPAGLPSVSEASKIKRLYASLAVQTDDFGLSKISQNGNAKETSLMPMESTVNSSDKRAEIQPVSQKDMSVGSVASSSNMSSAMTQMEGMLDETDTFTKIETNGSSSAADSDSERKVISKTVSVPSAGIKTRKVSIHPYLIKLSMRNKAFQSRKGKSKSKLILSNSSEYVDSNNIDAVSCNTDLSCLKEHGAMASCSLNANITVCTKDPNDGLGKLATTPSVPNCMSDAGALVSERSRLKEKRECSQSSLGDHSSSTTVSEQSNLSCSRGRGNKPRMSEDVRWLAIHQFLVQNGKLRLEDFKLLRRLGSGDIGTVYLAKLVDSDCLFAVKVMDNELLFRREKMLRAHMEKEILQLLDHPFLPTLYAHFTSTNLSCLVMEYCPGGDLHILRQRQPGKCFTEAAARFYIAEALLALEYLHMLGVVYRDLKPENILVRQDGHIMLSDFDLSLRCTVNPTLVRSSSLGAHELSRKLSRHYSELGSMEPPPRPHPSRGQVSCFTRPTFRKQKFDSFPQNNPLPLLIAEPTDARSNSFVGTHEYLAPEVIRGDGHGSSVDWWTLGVFFYELLYGRTPFKGVKNESTLSNIISQQLRFPEVPAVSSQAKDLIARLLMKEQECRLGSVSGAAEIKQHPFFKGLNWALVRCAVPPITPKSNDSATSLATNQKSEAKCLDFTADGKTVEFELF